MEILRVPPYPIVTTWDVPDADSDYVIYVEDVVDHSYETTNVTSDENAQITYTLPRSKVQYDRDFFFRVYDTNLNGEVVVDSNLTIYRPYIDPNTLGTTATEITEYKQWEIIARAIIDAYLANDSANGEGFYNHKLIIQGIGDGTDYFPCWHNPKKILKVYENNVLVYNGEDIELSIASVSASNGFTTIETSVANGFYLDDIVSVTESGVVTNYKITEIVDETTFIVKASNISEPTTVKRYWETTFAISPNNSALVKLVVGEYDRFESAPPRMPLGIGDIGFYGRKAASFPRNFDYTFILDVGYKAVPPDVEIATKMLIEDLKCGDNDYYKRFVAQYKTDQFDIKFAPQFLGGTGNLIVDKILDNYKGSVFKPGII